MDNLAVSLTGQVEEQEDPTMCLQHCTEAAANYVKLMENQENIGVKAGFLGSIELNNTKEMW